jgi:hypothetical protein
MIDSYITNCSERTRERRKAILYKGKHRGEPLWPSVPGSPPLCDEIGEVLGMLRDPVDFCRFWLAERVIYGNDAGPDLSVCFVVIQIL